MTCQCGHDQQDHTDNGTGNCTLCPCQRFEAAPDDSATQTTDDTTSTNDTDDTAVTTPENIATEVAEETPTFTGGGGTGGGAGASGGW